MKCWGVGKNVPIKKEFLNIIKLVCVRKAIFKAIIFKGSSLPPVALQLFKMLLEL